MIYVCIPSHDEAPTVGLVLWKLRKVFEAFGREYQLLVADDASTDGTSALLEPYAKVLPLTVVRNEERLGTAASAETLLRLALDRTDRPKRDCAILMHADFSHGPQFIPELVKRIDSGADLVVGEARLEGEPSRSHRLLRRLAPVLIRPAVRLAGVHDTVSGFLAVRLSVLRLALRAPGSALTTTTGWAANAELLARLGPHARRVETVATVERHDLKARPSRLDAWQEARALWQARPTIRAARRSAS
ncbi:MAG TPA: glycosyltransferase family 2 protein [Gemmatimonadales bacterium]|nr:glycosyltransferase family 2 protein [Gemmatimonadales bacterium]